MYDKAEIRSILAQHPEGFTLPQGLYSSQAAYEFDLEAKLVITDELLKRGADARAAPGSRPRAGRWPCRSSCATGRGHSSRVRC